MDKRENLSNYEKEFSIEIADTYVSCEDLVKCGVSNKILSAEVFLRNIYGDEIFNTQGSDADSITGEKRVVKINEDEMNLNSEYKKICSDIENSEFDKNLQTIVFD